MHYLLGAMAWRAVEYDEKVVIGVSLGEFVQEYLQRHPSSIPGRRYMQKTLPAGGFERRVQISPLVGAFGDLHGGRNPIGH
jgi:hypothetical protein